MLIALLQAVIQMPFMGTGWLPVPVHLSLDFMSMVQVHVPALMCLFTGVCGYPWERESCIGGLTWLAASQQLAVVHTQNIVTCQHANPQPVRLTCSATS